VINVNFYNNLILKKKRENLAKKSLAESEEYLPQLEHTELLV